MDGEWKGEVTKSLEFNDKEHERLFEAIEKFGSKNEGEHKEIRQDIVTLKIGAARSGSKWGAITAAGTSLAMMAASYIWKVICG